MSSVESDGQHVYCREYAVSLDAQDPLSHIRNEFFIPTRAQLKAQSLPEAESGDNISHDASIYLCGNSLGLQPKIVSSRMQQYFATWATQGVFGHFKPLVDSPLPIWLDADARASELIAPIVGAEPSEVAVMETLTANLHLLLSAFYKPDINGRHKIIIENQAFPSDHFVAESQIIHHNLSPTTSLITITPSRVPHTSTTLSTDLVIETLHTHATTTSLLLLPGIQYYTGQLLNIPLITSTAHSLGIFVILDLAHAVGNVPLQLHDWDVDAAAWCSYKYLNSGPGATGGLFVHSRHTKTPSSSSAIANVQKGDNYGGRLAGWWGSSKSTRFAMDNTFMPLPGAHGFQLSNPSILDLTSVCSSLEIFNLAGGMGPLRSKSLALTGHLETLLLNTKAWKEERFEIITPKKREERGAQLSLKLQEGLLEVVMEELVNRGVVVDERRPDVIRVAPAPLYNTFSDVWEFIAAFEDSVNIAVVAKAGKIHAGGTTELDMTI